MPIAKRASWMEAEAQLEFNKRNLNLKMSQLNSLF